MWVHHLRKRDILERKHTVLPWFCFRSIPPKCLVAFQLEQNKPAPRNIGTQALKLITYKNTATLFRYPFSLTNSQDISHAIPEAWGRLVPLHPRGGVCPGWEGAYLEEPTAREPLTSSLKIRWHKTSHANCLANISPLPFQRCRQQIGGKLRLFARSL